MIRLFTLIFFLPLWTMQSDASVDPAKKVLEEMTNIYSQVAYMKSDFSKVSKSNLLGTEEYSKGKLEYSRKKFRLDISSKPKSTFIKGEKFFWHISGKEITMGSVRKAVPSVFDAIFSDASVWSKLKSSYVSVPKKTAEIKVISAGKIPNVSEMTLYIDLEKKTLIRVSYLDDVQNSVDIKLSNTRFFDKAKSYRFVYKPKKSDKVNQI